MNTIDINKLQATLLSYEQINGNKRLNIFDIFYVKATPSDFAILLGAYIMDNYRTYDNYRLEHRFGYYWTKTSDEYDNAIIVRPDGSSIGEDLDWRDFGTRPVLSYSLIANESKIIKNLEKYSLTTNVVGTVTNEKVLYLENENETLAVFKQDENPVLKFGDY